MKADLNNITFQSKIKFVDSKIFQKKTKKLNPKKHFIGYPWSPNDMKKGKNIYTNEILDCIAGGIVQGGKVVAFHLATLNQKQAKKRNLKGFDIQNVERRLLEKIDLTKENVHALIFGGMQLKENSKYNVNKLNKIKEIFERHKIPYSIIGALRDVHFFGRFSMFYENKEDTWFITNSLSGEKTPEDDKVFVQGNKISYRKYDVIRDERGFCKYPSKRIETSVEDYFKSNFRQVELCEFDEFA